MCALVGELEARFDANLQVARSALEAARADPFVEDSRGQLRAHPGFAVAKSADELALRLAAELRLCRRQFPDEGADVI